MLWVKQEFDCKRLSRRKNCLYSICPLFNVPMIFLMCCLFNEKLAPLDGTLHIVPHCLFDCSLDEMSEYKIHPLDKILFILLFLLDIYWPLEKFFFLEHGIDIKCTHVQMQHNIVEVYKVNMTAYLTFWAMSISIFDDLSIKCEARTWNFIFDPNCIPINLPYPNDHCTHWMINKLYYMLYTSVRIFQIQFLACNKTDSHDKLDSVNEEKSLGHNKVSH